MVKDYLISVLIATVIFSIGFYFVLPENDKSIAIGAGLLSGLVSVTMTKMLKL